MSRRDPARSAWFVPAVVWVAGFVVLAMLAFGTATQCTTTRPEGECAAIDDWFVLGVIVAGLVAALPVSRSLREQAAPWQVTTLVGVVMAVTVIGMYTV